MSKDTFAKQQERLWKTADALKEEYARYLMSLSREQLMEELMESMVDRCYAAFTTDLVMNTFLEEELLSEKEANELPIAFFRSHIEHLKEKRRSKGSLASSVIKASRVRAKKQKKPVKSGRTKKIPKKKVPARKTVRPVTKATTKKVVKKGKKR